MPHGGLSHVARGYDVPPSLGRVQVDTDDREQKQRSGVIPHPGPAHPQYASYEARLRSYREWPPGLSQDPATMAEAGLYYYGISDQVTTSIHLNISSSVLICVTLLITSLLTGEVFLL